MEHGSVTLSGLALIRGLLQFGWQTVATLFELEVCEFNFELPDVTLALLIEKLLVKYRACDNMFFINYSMKIPLLLTPFKENFPSGRKISRSLNIGVICPLLPQRHCQKFSPSVTKSYVYENSYMYIYIIYYIREQQYTDPRVLFAIPAMSPTVKLLLNARSHINAGVLKQYRVVRVLAMH